MLPGADWTKAVDIAERSRRSVERLETKVVNPAGGDTIRLGHDGLPQCTISIGVATSPEQGSDIVALERYSDQLLEAAKQNGRRNQVVALAMLVQSPAVGGGPETAASAVRTEDRRDAAAAPSPGSGHSDDDGAVEISLPPQEHRLRAARFRACLSVRGLRVMA
ncbi:hypothetical protein [Amycolatopsis sp. NPDC004079]|uniref:hypothetical protein n=1 Tax=Amycolatopsis sp. NPDC004079 TaxID=3154549 RepID=UPI0033B064A7